MATSLRVASEPRDSEGVPIFRKSGDDYWGEWQDFMVRMRVGSVYEKEAALHGELVVYVDLDGAPSPAEWTQINLSSSQTRASTANRLKEQWSGIKPPPYREMLGELAIWIAEQFRQGEPLKRLSLSSPKPQQRYTLWPILPAGQISTVYADGGSGKSYLLLLMLLMLQENLPVLGLRPVKSRVLYLDFECNWDEQQLRLHRIAEGLGLTKVNDVLYRECYRPIHKDVAQIRRMCDDEGVDVVAIDSMGLAAGGDPKEASDTIRTMASMRELRRTVIALDHVTKDGEQGKAIGSGFKFNYSRAAWEIKKVQEAGGDDIHIGLFHRKVNNGPLIPPMGFHIQFEGDDGPVTIIREDVRDVEGLAERVSLRARIEHTLTRGPLTLEAIGAELPDQQIESIRRTLYRMRDATPPMVIQMGQRWGLAAR